MYAIIYKSYNIIVFDSPFEHDHHCDDDYNNSSDQDSEKYTHSNDSTRSCM